MTSYYGDPMDYLEAFEQLREDTLILAFQIHGLREALKEKGEVRFTFFKPAQAAKV